MLPVWYHNWPSLCMGCAMVIMESRRHLTDEWKPTTGPWTQSATHWHCLHVGQRKWPSTVGEHWLSHCKTTTNKSGLIYNMKILFSLSITYSGLHRRYDYISLQNKARIRDWNTLQYSLRSVEKFAPWIRNVYVVTNGQVPSWVNTTAVRVVTHKEIFQACFLVSLKSFFSCCFNKAIGI